MSRYYYRPVDNGMGELGANIGRGLQSVALGVANRRDRKKQEERQKKADERADQIFALDLYQRGARLGTAPTRTRDMTIDDGDDDSIYNALRIPEMPAPESGIGVRFRNEPLPGGGDVGISPDVVRSMMGEPVTFEKPRFTIEEPDPRYLQITPDIFIDSENTPEARARRAKAQEQFIADQRAESARQTLEDEIFALLTGMRTDVDDPTRRGMAGTASREPSLIDNFLTPPKPDYEGERVKETKRHNEAMEKLQADRNRNARSKDDDTAEKAYEDHYRRAAGYAKSLVEQGWSRREDGTFDAAAIAKAVQQWFPKLRQGDAENATSEALKGNKPAEKSIVDQPRAGGNTGKPQQGPRTFTSRSKLPMKSGGAADQTDDNAAARELVRGMDPAKARRFLQEAGFDPDSVLGTPTKK